MYYSEVNMLCLYWLGVDIDDDSSNEEVGRRWPRTFEDFGPDVFIV